MIALLLALACARRAAPPEVAPVAVPISAQPPAPTGVIADGQYTDGRYDLTVPVPDGWRARPGHGDGALRVALEHLDSETRVEIWAFEGADEQPRRREGCAWTFVDRGSYRALKVAGEYTVSTCTPENPIGPVVFAYLLARSGVVWQVEITAPRDDLAHAKQLGDGLVAGIRW